MSNSKSVKLYSNLSDLDAAFEGLDKALDPADRMSVEQAAKALLDEALLRISNFVPRPDKVQDAVNQALATALLDTDNPIEVIISNLISTVRSLKSAQNQAPSNAAECGVTDAPVGTDADKVRDKLESILMFARNLNRQVTRGAFYRIGQVERQIDAKAARQQSAKKNAAGEFVGEFATLDDRVYMGWNRVTVEPETIRDAAVQVTDALKQIYEKVCTSGAVSEWFVSNNPFDYGSTAVQGAKGVDYERWISLEDAFKELAKSVSANTRERATAAEITAGFRI